MVSRSAAGTPPSTRAGGQDDGSLNKLPETYNIAAAGAVDRELGGKYVKRTCVCFLYIFAEKLIS